MKNLRKNIVITPMMDDNMRQWRCQGKIMFAGVAGIEPSLHEHRQCNDLPENYTPPALAARFELAMLSRSINSRMP